MNQNICKKLYFFFIACKKKITILTKENFIASKILINYKKTNNYAWNIFFLQS